MRGTETTSIETLVLFLVIALLLFSVAARVWFFRKEFSDPKLLDLIGDASSIGADTLAFRLALNWKHLSKKSRQNARYFVWPYLIAFFGLIGFGIIAFFRFGVST